MAIEIKKRRLLLVRQASLKTCLLVQTIQDTPADASRIQSQSVMVVSLFEGKHTFRGGPLWVSEAGHLAVFGLTLEGGDVPPDILTDRKVAPADVSITIDNTVQPVNDPPVDLYEE